MSKRIFFHRDYEHHLTKYQSVVYRAADELHVEDELADLLVAKGVAIYSDFAEDNLFDVGPEIDEVIEDLDEAYEDGSDDEAK
jgi:hypothetical protein